MSERSRVADYWDQVLAQWVSRPDDPAAHLTSPLPRWFASYQGTGKGAVDLGCYPDPFVGDLRGDTHDIRLVVLGLNPGVGYPSLQGHGGLWTERIRTQGYSHCLHRSPAEDPDAWLLLHDSESRYWRNLTTFARRWLDDRSAGVHDVLNFELYPWHAAAVVGEMKPPADLLHEYVWLPVMEVPTPVVFAFGAAFFDACDALELPELGRWGRDGRPFPDLAEDKGWRLGAYLLPTRQVVAVSAQPGYSGPPGTARLKIMRRLLTDLEVSIPGPGPSTAALGDPVPSEPHLAVHGEPHRRPQKRDRMTWQPGDLTITGPDGQQTWPPPTH